MLKKYVVSLFFHLVNGSLGIINISYPWFNFLCFYGFKIEIGVLSKLFIK